MHVPRASPGPIPPIQVSQCRQAALGACPDSTPLILAQLPQACAPCVLLDLTLQAPGSRRRRAAYYVALDSIAHCLVQPRQATAPLVLQDLTRRALGFLLL